MIRVASTNSAEVTDFRWNAQWRGQFAAGLDMAAEVDQLVGLVYHRVLVTG